MIRIIAAFLLIMFVIEEANAKTVYIGNDYGGLISVYNTRFRKYKRLNSRVVIDGACMSACVRFMGLTRSCATKSGYFYFHGITNANGNLEYKQSIEDSLAYDLPKAYALEEKYDAFSFHRTENPGPSEEVVEEGVSIVYRRMKDAPSTYMKFLKVQANLIIPKCN